QTTAEKFLDHRPARRLSREAPLLTLPGFPRNPPPMKGRSMFASLARLFGQPATRAAQPLEPRLAVAALLVHLASVDGASNRIEAKAIADALAAHYGLDEGEVRKLLAEARIRDREAVDFYQFTSRLARLDDDEKTAIIAMMWQVVFADDTNHELE